MSHNLGAGLTQKMFQYIMACFTKARERFGDRQQEVPEDIDPTGYFFNKGILTSYSDIPKDRYDVFRNEKYQLIIKEPPTLRESVSAGIKFCECREFWLILRKLVPPKIIRKPPIRKVCEILFLSECKVFELQ